MDTAIQTHTPQPPMNLGSAFDLALPLSDRCDTLMAVLEYAATLMIEREEGDTPDAYADPEFRRQEIKRRTLAGVEGLRQAANILELRWAMKNGHQKWQDESGAEVDLLETIEHQMPNEDQRGSSGRARQIWMFAAGEHSAVAAFREQGIPDQEIAKVGTSGMSSVLGIVAAARKKLEDATPPEELREKYETLIGFAAETTNLDVLRKKIRTLIDPTDTPPPPIPYSVESDDESCWVVAHPTEGQFTEVFLNRLKDVLELDKLLPQDFVRYWESFITVPVGQGA